MRHHSQSISCQLTPPHHNDIKITLITQFYSLLLMQFDPPCWYCLSAHLFLRKPALSRHTALHFITYRYKYNYKPSSLFLCAPHRNLPPTTLPPLTLTSIWTHTSCTHKILSSPYCLFSCWSRQFNLQLLHIYVHLFEFLFYTWTVFKQLPPCSYTPQLLPCHTPPHI